MRRALLVLQGVIGFILLLVGETYAPFEMLFPSGITS